MIERTELTWLDPQASAWRAGVDAGRGAHAVLIAGPRGVGKRALGEWMAARQLGVGPATDRPVFPAALPPHPDLYRIHPGEDGKSILIEQIRELVNELSLTSHSGRGKVALIEPADAMTGSAANSLLKTLEEPPGHALLILVSDRAGRLPPTVRSRCSTCTVAVPAAADSLAWLDRLRPGGNWGAALRESGGAPLAALEAEERLDQTEAMARDFAGIAERRASPVDVAGRWAKEEPAIVLEWLARQVQRCIHRACGSAAGTAGVAVPDSVLNRIDRRKLFCYLDAINGLRGQPPGSFNVQLTLESLLIDWARGLTTLSAHPAAPSPSGAG